MKRKYIAVIIVLCLIVVTALSCTHADESTSILPADAVLRPGDIVMRRGTGVMSRMVYTADINGQYSHIGIAADTDSGIVIVHAVPDEPDFPEDVDRVKVDRPQEFFSIMHAERGAIIRVADSVAAPVAARYALGAYERRVLFDHDFDDNDTTMMYCCELINRAYLSAGVDLVGNSRHYISVPGIKSVECIFPSDIYDSPLTATVANF